MLKKTITYKDYNGNERTEDFYFNLSSAEIIEMEMSVSGGFIEYINGIIRKQDGPSIIKNIKEVVLKAYGEKTADGRGFRKSEEISNNFMHTEAYSVLFTELVTNAEAASEFFNAIVPQSIDEHK